MDSQRHIIHCLSSAIDTAGFNVPEVHQIRHIIGLSLQKAIQQLLPRGVSVTEIEQVADLYREEFFNADENPSQLFEGVETLLKNLHQQGYYLAVATGKARRGLDIALQSTSLESFFHITRCADETRSKPDPLMLEEILTDLDLQPQRAVMVGDTTYDIEMAHHINMPSIAVTWGMHDRKHLEKVQPNFIFDSFEQLQQAF